jgi:hypothetical protein
MVSEVRVYDGNGKLKETISREKVLEHLYRDCENYKNDGNLKAGVPQRETTAKRRERNKVRYVKCWECLGRIETRSGLTVLYCHNRCGENYRRKGIKSGAWFKGIKMKEIVWDEPQATRKGIGKYS